MSRSSKAAHYGALAEKVARERYDLEAAHDSWHDAVTDDGRPVEVKAAMLNRARGVPRFRIFERYHRRLVRESGLYVFVAYRAAGRGIQPRAVRSLEASSLNVSSWYGAGGHRESQQVKLPVSSVFK